MNKKFLSAILFGALMVGSTSTFVSCKDYDDDIDGLQEQIDANKKQIDDILAAINGKKFIESYAPVDRYTSLPAAATSGHRSTRTYARYYRGRSRNTNRR